MSKDNLDSEKMASFHQKQQAAVNPIQTEHPPASLVRTHFQQETIDLNNLPESYQAMQDFFEPELEEVTPIIVKKSKNILTKTIVKKPLSLHQQVMYVRKEIATNQKQLIDLQLKLSNLLDRTKKEIEDLTDLIKSEEAND